MARLGVNVDHVATVRQARRADEPDPVWAAVEAQLAGASCITIHLREDRRHINDRDARVMKEVVNVKFNLEMSLSPKIVAIACKLQPTQITLVPERREELTTEGGLDVVRLRKRIAPVVQKLRKSGIICSAFIEPIPEQVTVSAELGFEAVELWTGGFAHARGEKQVRQSLDALEQAVATGFDRGVEVHAGHGLTYRNVARVARIPGFGEFNIGHSIVARAMFVGMRQATKEMIDILRLSAPRMDE